MDKTNHGLVQWARGFLGQAYWYGTYGQSCSEALLQKKMKQYPAHYGVERMAAYRKQILDNKRCFDCAGLIKGYMWSDDAGDIRYNSNGFLDASANGIYNAAKVRGDMRSMPERAGLLVRFDGHVGVYEGGGLVLEARGFAYGVVRTKLNERKWTHWLECPGLRYLDGGAPLPAANPTLRKGDKGAEVKRMQGLLIERGCRLPTYGPDGSFGEETDAAVRAFQTARGLAVDGVVGPKTWAALSAAVDTATHSVRVRRLTEIAASGLAEDLRQIGYDAMVEGQS